MVGSETVFCGTANFTRAVAPAPSCTSVGPQGVVTYATSGTLDFYAYGVQNANTVYFPTWSDVNGQDDIVWYQGVSQGGGTWKGTVNLANHRPGNPDYGLIYVHVWMVGSETVFCGTANFTRAVSQAPQAVSVTPSSGSGSSQSFAFLYSDPNGYTDLASLYGRFNATASDAAACSFRYDRASNYIYLYNDAGTAWLGPVVLGNQLGNSQCTLTGGSASPSGNNLTLSLTITFNASFAGAKNVYMQAVDAGGASSGWQTKGAWTVPSGGTAPIAVYGTGVVSAGVPAADGAVDAHYALTSSPDPAYPGPNALVINSNEWPVAPIGPWVANDSNSKWIGPRRDAGTSPYNAPGSYTYRTTFDLTGFNAATAVLTGRWATDNSGSIRLNGATVGTSSNTFDVFTAFTINTGFVSGVNTLEFVVDNWTTPPSPTGVRVEISGTAVPTGNQPPQTVSVTPSSGSGLGPQQFQFLYSDPNGYADLASVYGRFSATASEVGACSFRYDRASNYLYLYNDAGTAWLGPVALGSQLNNSQCTLSAGSTTPSGNNLTLNLTITFTASFAGAKNVYMQAVDAGGASSGWQVRGVWTVFATQYTTVEALNNCISSSPSGSTCTLAPTTYTVTTPIVIGRSSITVKGGGATRSDTVLVRAPGNTAEMMLVDAAQPLTGITIQNLTFCGSSTLSTPPSPCPSPAQTACGTRTQQATNGEQTPPLCVDLAISHADTGGNPANPFSNTGPYSVTLLNCAFEGATGHAMALYPTIPKKVNDIYISGSAINSSEVTGILSGVNGAWYGHRWCDLPGLQPPFRDNPADFSPRNVRIEDNTFANNNTGAIGMSGAARWVGLRNNTFTNNYFNPQAGNQVGGSVFFDQCTDTVQIYRNTLTGPSTWAGTEGLELWGRNIQVGADDANQRNMISAYLSEGISANSVFDTTIKNNTTFNNGSANLTGGIQVWTAGPGGGCDPVPRDTETVAISGNTSAGQPYGVYLGDRGRSTNTIKDTITVDNSGVIGLNPYVTLNGWSPGLPPAPGPVQDAQLPPRALAVDAISPLWRKCSTVGSPREVFTFPASDVMGSGNIAWLQGIFSVSGNDDTGSGGPDNGAQGCHFIYFPPENPASCTPSSGCGALYLDGDSGGFNWIPATSVVGPGGTDLANSYCRIHAGSPDSKVVFEPKVLKLTLDIEFLSSSRKHMYTVTYNKDNKMNSPNVYGSAWWYSGWWSPIP